MSADRMVVIVCDDCGEAAPEPQTFEGEARRAAELFGWTFDGDEDHCPREVLAQMKSEPAS